MSEEECRRVIKARNHPKEARVADVTREILRPDANIPSKWEFLEEALAKSRDMARESNVGPKVWPRGSDASSSSFSRWGDELTGWMPYENKLKGPQRSFLPGIEESRPSIKLVASRFKVEALRSYGADLDVNGKKSHVELEVVRGEERVALLGSREVELLIESEVAQAEVEQLRVELQRSRANLARL
ncbi:hypothetical protein ACLOJK_028714 [Asimina triloba]